MNSPTKRLLNPERQRQLPAHFSWLDHRLVREHYIEKADVFAWALYLFLVTVADACGLSCYSEASLYRRPQMDAGRLSLRDPGAKDLLTAPPHRVQAFSRVVDHLQPVSEGIRLLALVRRIEPAFHGAEVGLNTLLVGGQADVFRLLAAARKTAQIWWRQARCERQQSVSARVRQ